MPTAYLSNAYKKGRKIAFLVEKVKKTSCDSIELNVRKQ